MLLCTALLRWRLLDVPFERDEGEFAYAGQLLLQGVAPFTQAYNMKMPGIYVVYALMMAVFGESIRGVHLGLLVANWVSIVLMYFLGRRLYGSMIGLISAIFFALLAIGQWVQGVFAQSEHFVLVFALAGILLALHARESKTVWAYLISGVLLGMAVVVKQHGAMFAAFTGVFLLADQINQRKQNHLGQAALRLGVFGTGLALPFGLICFWLWRGGVFARFWFWTYSYAQEYVLMMPPNLGWVFFSFRMSNIVPTAGFVWLLALAGLVVLILDRARPKRCLGVLGFFCFSFLALCPGLYFRPHYFVLWLPAIALLAGVGVCGITEKWPVKAAYKMAGCIMLVSMTLVQSLYTQQHYLFGMDMTQVCRSIYGTCPFPESLKIAAYIKAHTRPDEKIGIFGSEPQICFYAQRRSATGYIYMYALLENQRFAGLMRQEMIAEIEAQRPAYMVYVHVSNSWFSTQHFEPGVFIWAQEYLQRNYQRVGLVDMHVSGTRYLWDDAAANVQPTSKNWLAIFKRAET